MTATMQVTVRSLAQRGAGVAQIARRTRLPQDVVSMLLLVSNEGRQKTPDSAASASMMDKISRIFRRITQQQVTA